MSAPKRKASWIAIYAIAAAVFVLLTITIPFPKPAASWVMFAFAVLAIAGGCGISLYAFCKSEELTSKFYGFPIFRIGFLYTAVQVGLTVIVYIVGALVAVPYWVALALSVVLVGLAAIGVIATDNARDYVEAVDSRIAVVTKTVKRFQVDIADLTDLCRDPEVAVPLKKLAEKFKYSDCVSSAATEAKEAEIQTEIDVLRRMLNGEDREAVLAQIQTVSALLSSRNRLCEAGK